jgi:hypothetical protein
MTKLGVFCLEGDWESRMDDRTSVLPMLQMLEGLGIIKFIRRDVATEEELKHYLRRWSDYSSYKLLYLGFHGDPDWLDVGADGIDLQWLQEQIGERAKGKLIHFGSCSTLDVSKSRREQFRQTTKSRGLSGYRKEVDWIDSAAFELALLRDLGSRQGRPEIAYQYMDKHYRQRAKDLGFVHGPE